MTKKLTALLLALILCVGLLPTAAFAGEPTWTGGNDPNCQHENFTGQNEPVDDKNHQYKLTCSDCGAKGTLPFDEPQPCTDSNGDKKCDDCNQAMPVQQTDIADANVKVNTIFGNNTEYQTGTDPITPSVTVYDKNGDFMYQGSDYSVEYANNTDAGTGRIILTGLPGGRLKGTRTETFTIKKLNGDLANSSNTVYLFGGNSDGTFNYTGSQIKPSVMVELDDNGTLWDSCYTVKYGENIGPGQGSVTITGTGETAYGVPITGTRTVYFKIVKVECSHADFTYVSDGYPGHHMHCNICGTDFEIEDHDWGVEKEVDQGNEVDIYKVCGAAGCGFEWPDRTEKKLDKCTVTYPAGKSAGSEFTESEARQIGLEGLTSGEDFTTQVSSKKNDDGTESWVVELKPVQGKSRGEQVVTVKKPCLHVDFTYISDGFSGHHMHCNICGTDFEIEDHDWGVDKEVDQGNEIDIYKVCGAAGCGFEWPDRTVKKLDRATVTGLKGSGAVYNESEANQVGLEGLTAGVDYTKTVQDGGDQYIVIMEPIEGKTVGSRQVELNKCKHETTVCINDGDDGHHYECAVCGQDMSEGQILAHAVETVDEDAGTHIFRMEKCTVCPWTKEIGQMWKLDQLPVTGLKGAGEIYTEEEAKSIGLEGLTEGVEYTRTVTSKVDNDGGESWVVKLGPVEGKSVQEVEVTVRKSAQHEHLLAWVTDNEQNHWQVCTVEGCRYSTDPEAHAYAAKLVTAASCTQDAAIQMECKCGRVDPNGRTAPQEGDPAEWFAHHTWSAEYESDFWEHWRTCTVCHVAEDKQPHALTNVNVLVKNECITNGSITADCSVCGKKDMSFSSGIDADVDKFPMLEQYKALGHDFSGPVTWFTGPRVCTEEGQGTHAPTCVRCNAHDDANQTAHAWAGLHTVQNGSCDNPNDPVIQEAECECGATLHIEKQREHVWVDDKSQDVQATCLEPGKINGQRCMICGTFGNYDFVPALGHDIQIPDQLAATCEKEGYIHRVCSRGDLDETEILKTLSPDGHHHFEPLASQAPTCTTEGKYSGEKCKYCPATQAGETGYGIVPALGHKVVSRTASHGKTRTAVGKDGRPIEMQVYVTTFSCSRCGASLGGETFTVATSIGKLSGQYRIEPGVVTITDMENGIHVKGNMSNDGGVYFNGVVQEAYEDVVKDAGKKYTYKKVETKSFIIEFTDEFLSELEDGEYEMVVINGSEYWPMMVTVRDHKFKALRDVDIPDMPELTEEEFDALLKELSADGEIIRRFFLNQPVIMPENDGAPNENGDIVVVKSDGDYVFESLVNGDYTLEADKDYTIEEDTVTIKADYLSGVPSESEIVFHYAEFGMEGAPLPHEPKLPIQ